MSVCCDLARLWRRGPARNPRSVRAWCVLRRAFISAPGYRHWQYLAPHRPATAPGATRPMSRW